MPGLDRVESPITQWRIAMDIIQLYERNGRWWVQFDGSGEALCLGPGTPDLKVGETVDVIVRKRT